MARRQKEVPRPWSGKRFIENSESVPCETPFCAICGRAIKKGEVAQWCEVVEGGARFARIDEAADPNDGGYMGAWPVGATCARLFPAGYLSERPR